MNMITCPHCNKDIAIITQLTGSIMVSALCKDKNGELYQPRERWKIDSSEIEKTRDFIFKTWGDVVIMRFYELNGNLLKEFRN